MTSDFINIRGKTALITGASRGIGREIALALAEEGVSCVLVARDEMMLKKLATSLEAKGVEAIPFPCDATQHEDVKKLYEFLNQKEVKIDILVNNVGVGKYGALEDFSLEDYDWMMNTNMRSTFLFTHFFLPPMLKQKDGDLVFIGSVAGLRGLPGEAVYCASKHAQMAFAQSLDYECREKNVRVAVIAPGGVHTDFAMGTGREPGMPLLDRMLNPSDVAEAVRFTLLQQKNMRYFLVGMRPLSESL